MVKADCTSHWLAPNLLTMSQRSRTAIYLTTMELHCGRREMEPSDLSDMDTLRDAYGHHHNHGEDEYGLGSSPVRTIA